MKKVLLIEDNDVTQMRWEMHLGKHAEVLQAHSLAEAYMVMGQHSDIAIFVIDGFVGEEGKEQTLDLIHDIAMSYPSAKLIAASSDWEMRQDQRVRGCGYEAEGKNYVPAVVINLLKEA